jgi:ribosomal protein L40E
MQCRLYYAKHSVNWLAGRQLAHLEQHLRALKAKQRLKIEELKERSDYYRTQKLLERFDVASPAATHNNKKTGPKNQSSKLESAKEDTKQIDEGTASSASLSSSISSSAPLSSTLSLSSGMAARLVHPRGWLDRWTDYVLGEEEAMVRYALVCTRCYAHNGLSLVPLTPFACRRCSHVNNLPPSSATSTGHAPPQGSDEDATAVSKKGAPQRHALEERIRRQLSTVASPDQDATPLAQAPQHLWPPKRDSNHDSAEEEQKKSKVT